MPTFDTLIFYLFCFSKVFLSLDKDDPEYLAKRAKNNEAIKRSREKARQKVAHTKHVSSVKILCEFMKNSYSTQLLQATETKEKVDALKSDNKELEDKITALGQVGEKPSI